MVQEFTRHVAAFIAGAALVTGALLLTQGASARIPQAQIEATVVEPLAVSQVLHYQGRLLTPNTGVPKADGAYQMAFSIYNTASGGAPLWSESKSVQVANGAFSTLLGNVTPLPVGAFNGDELFLGVTVGSDPEVSPRQRLAHVAYAMHAEDAGSLDGLDSSAFAAADHYHGEFYLFPIAFAFIDFDGSMLGGTSNVTSSWDENLSVYRITVSDRFYLMGSFATLVTPSCGNVTFSVNTDDSGDALIAFYDSGGSQVQCNFQFAFWEF